MCLRASGLEKKECLCVAPALRSEQSHMFHCAAKTHAELKFPPPARFQTSAQTPKDHTHTRERAQTHWRSCPHSQECFCIPPSSPPARSQSCKWDGTTVREKEEGRGENKGTAGCTVGLFFNHISVFYNLEHFLFSGLHRSRQRHIFVPAGQIIHIWVTFKSWTVDN